MIITPHLLIGAALGAHSPNIWAAFGLGLISHYLLDAIPHWDYLTKVVLKNPSHRQKMALDFILGALLVLVLAWSHPQKLFILAGLIGGLLPDCLSVPYMNYKIKCLKPLFFFHKKIHHDKRLSFAQGLPGLLITCSIAILALVT